MDVKRNIRYTEQGDIENFTQDALYGGNIDYNYSAFNDQPSNYHEPQRIPEDYYNTQMSSEGYMNTQRSLDRYHNPQRLREEDFYQFDRFYEGFNTNVIEIEHDGSDDSKLDWGHLKSFFKGTFDRNTKGQGDEEELLQKKNKEDVCLCVGICRYIGQQCYNFITSPTDAYVPLKTALGFPFGLLLAYGLYRAVITPMKVSEQTRHLLGALLALAVSCGYALHSEIRCIVCLLIPTFFGKTGRSYVGTLAIAYLIEGPVHNILTNGKEVTRSLSCAAELSANHTRAKWELKMKPLEDVMEEFQTEGLYMNKVVNRVDTAFAPMKKEIRDQEDAEKMKSNTQKVDRISGEKRGNRWQKIQNKNKYSKRDSREKQAEKKYRAKIDLQCENVWNEGVLRCRDKFGDLEKRCLRTIPFIGYLLCLPLKMVFFCELVRLVPGASGMDCNSVDVLEPGFGETYVASEDMVNVMDENFEVNLQYKLVQSKESLDYTSAEEIRKATMHEFERRQFWMKWITIALSRLLGFTFLRVIYSSYCYNKKYLSDFSFDNMYITDYFEHIDRRRTEQRKRGLLPLKKSERSALVYPWSFKIMKSEKKKLMKGTFLIFMRGLISGIIIYSDYLLYTVMDLIRRHSQVDYVQFGKHHIKVTVYGTGFMSNIVRMFVKSFDAKHSIDNVSTNFECLPRPVAMENKYIIYIYAAYAGVWILMILESYGLRLRRLVASFFYRKREKSRILFLYNDLFKKRKGLTRHLRHEVRRKVKKNTLSKKTSLLASIRKEFPKCCGWLKAFESGKEKCIICDEPESSTFVRCGKKGCPFGYCLECWWDVRCRCYACMPEDPDDSDLTEIESETSGEEEI